MSSIEQYEKRLEEIKKILSTLQNSDEILKLNRERIELIGYLSIEIRKTAEDLVKELQTIYSNVNSVWDLVNTKVKYPELIPILTKHLTKEYHPNIKEGIVRALTVKEAKGIACRVIIDEYKKASKDNFYYAWSYGNTMKVIITKDYLNEIIEIVLNEENGDSRDMFIEAISKFKTKEVEETINILINNKSELISNTAMKSLKKLKK